MKKFIPSVFLSSTMTLMACGERIQSEEGYELSDIENPGESLGEETDEDEDTDEFDEMDDQDQGDVPEEQTEEETADHRTFAQKLVVSMLMPGVFDSSNYEETITTSYLLVHWERTGTSVSWTEMLCHIESTEAHGTQTEFPSAFVATMPIREHRATLSAAEVGADFTVSPFYNVDGADLSSPATDSLPTTVGDGRLWDQDSDGNPGITIHIEAPFGVRGDVYLTQRSRYEYEGFVVAQDRVEAYVDYEQEQSIIEATSPFLTMAEIVPITNPDPTTSYVIFQQVDDGTNCDAIKRSRNSLF